MTEDELLTAVMELAKFAGYRACHFRPLRTEQTRTRKRDGAVVKIWKTAVQGDSGWPDVILCGHGRFVVAELKDADGKPSGEQRAWIDALQAAGIQCVVWRPADWTSGEIARALGCDAGVIPGRR